MPAAPVSMPAAAPVASPMQNEQGVRLMQEAFQNSKVIPHWPMYLRNVKQFIKNSSPTFDEHRYGFHSFLEAVRSAQRAGLFRLERNRQGILRVFPGNLISQMQRTVGPRGEGQQLSEPPVKPYDVEDDITLQQQVQMEAEPASATPVEETASETESAVEQPVIEEAAPVAEEKPARKRRVSSGIKRKTVAPRKSTSATLKRSRKKTVPPEEEPA